MTENGRNIDIPVHQLEGLAADQRETLNKAVYAGAAHDFRYLFDTIRLSDEVRAGRPVAPVLSAAYEFLNGESFLAFARELTGDPRPRFADAQATRYLPGHFLTTHDDASERKGRLYAYVLNLTPEWRPDWGGLLLFLNERGHVTEGYAPTFNALNIFRVPQRHSVSMVAPFAPVPRLSITGWIRSEVPPPGAEGD